MPMKEAVADPRPPRKRGLRWKLALSALLMCMILIRSREALACAQSAMRLWAKSVAPALFPFLALMPLLTGAEACAAYDALFSGWMRPLFHLPGAAAPAMVVGMISGSPAGAAAVRRIVEGGAMTGEEANRLALCIAGLSPAYLVVGVGTALYGSAQFGLKLALIQAAVQLLLLIALRGFSLAGQAKADLPGTAPAQPRGGIMPAVETVLSVCGYMVIFGVAAGVIASVAGKHAGTGALLLLDLPSGLSALSGLSFPGRAMLTGAAIGFGGLSIAAQNMDQLRHIGVRWKQYLAIRGIAAALIGCMASLLSGAETQPVAQSIGKPSLVYAFSLLIACTAAIPGLIYLSKNLFLNNSNAMEKEEIDG